MALIHKPIIKHKHIIKIYNDGVDLDKLKKDADKFFVDPVAVTYRGSSNNGGVVTHWFGVTHYLLEFKNQEDAMLFKLKYQGPAEYFVE